MSTFPGSFGVIPRQVGASAYAPFSPWSAGNGTSDSIPFETTGFQTDTGMHDPTIAVSSTATSGGSTTLTDTSQSWTVNAFTNYIVKITGGTGSGQWRKVASNTATVLTVSSAWGTNPNGTSTYKLFEKAHKLIVPEDGLYMAQGHASIDYNAGLLGIFFYVNNVFTSLHYTHQSRTVELNGHHSRFLNLLENDEVEMRIFNGDTVHRNMFGGQARLYFQLVRQ